MTDRIVRYPKESDGAFLARQDIELNGNDASQLSKVYTFCKNNGIDVPSPFPHDDIHTWKVRLTAEQTKAICDAHAMAPKNPEGLAWV